MREEERFEEENISRESCQEPREENISRESCQEPREPREPKGSKRIIFRESLARIPNPPHINKERQNNQRQFLNSGGGGAHVLINQRLGLVIPKRD